MTSQNNHRHRVNLLAMLLLATINAAQINNVYGAGGGTDVTSGRSQSQINADRLRFSKGKESSNLQQKRHFNLRGNYVVAGVGLRGTTAGTILITGIPATATVEAAYLYWSFLDNGPVPSQAQITFEGAPFSGSGLGSGPDTCWFRQFSRAFHAEVTPVVTGNGTYVITNVASGGSILAQGASLLVIYRDSSENLRTIVIADGNAVVRRETPEFGPPTIISQTNTLGGFTAYNPGSGVEAKTTFIVGDGQLFTENASFTGGAGTISFNGFLDGSDGRYWDTDTHDVSSQVAVGDTSVSVNINLPLQSEFDCLNWVAQIFSVTTVAEGPSPEIRSVKPNLGVPGTVVTIVGRNFGFTHDSGFVSFGSQQASVTSWTSNQIKAVAPPASSLETVPVTVTTPTGQSNNDKTYTYTEGGEAEKCIRRFFRPKNCSLLAKLRHNLYLGIPRSEISDNQLLEYINKHEDALTAQVLEIDYGLQVSSFVNFGPVDSTVEKQFYRAIGDAAADLLPVLEALVRILDTINESVARAVLAESLAVFSKILEGYRIYRLALNVITTPNTRVIMEFYISERGSQDSEFAWQSILRDFREPIQLISKGKRIPVENLANWFEQAFAAYRLATSEEIRHAKGVAIARIALAE